jgi:hypothetical protein
MNVDIDDHHRRSRGGAAAEEEEGGSSSRLLPRPSSEESEEWTVEGDDGDDSPTPEGFYVDHHHNNNQQHLHHQHRNDHYRGTTSFINGGGGRGGCEPSSSRISEGIVGMPMTLDHRRSSLPGISEESTRGGGGDGGIAIATMMSSPSPLSSFLNRPTLVDFPPPPTDNVDACDNYDDDDSSSQIDSFTPNALSGIILSYISNRFVPRNQRHTHGGSALAGFLALLLVTCANCMLGPMRDAAALAVGVSHIPALTLASTVLALGSSVPVGWLFEAPDPRRRRLWKRMGLTRGETQGTSLALFYRVFAFLLLSYALGFVLVDRYGGGGGGGGGGDGSIEGVVAEEEGGRESAISLIAAFSLRAMAGIGMPVSRILTFAMGMPGVRHFIEPFVVVLETCTDEPISSLFLRACARVVNKFGKVIYIMFFLVVHLMKLHSLSLIWGVTTEAMEYEESAEQRRAGARDRGANSGNDNDKRRPPLFPPSSAKPSMSSLRLKRLGFVGFGGTLGGILGR